ncbi:MAG: hypothetical protein HY060_00380 [Proteobacteria bacterium]|nr:hypothetical protein [Pseudomonadota bacterium]
MSASSDRRIIFEIIQLGDYVKVSAVDTVTMIEVSAIGPARGALDAVKQVALQKLKRAIARGGVAPDEDPDG